MSVSARHSLRAADMLLALLAALAASSASASAPSLTATNSAAPRTLLARTSCVGRQGLNLKGELLNDGATLIKDKAEDCCRDCADLPACNVWVFCEVGLSLPGGVGVVVSWTILAVTLF
jgi:hypothetical protein